MSSSSDSYVLVIIRTPPNADLEAAELILALAAFDLPVKVVFSDGGLFWLLPQQARKPNGKAAPKVLSAFPLYGIETLGYLADDAVRFGIATEHMPANACPLTPADFQQHLQHAGCCLTF